MGDANEPKNQKALYNNMGAFLGLLGKGLKGFSHKGSNHKLLWDVKETENLFDILEFIVKYLRYAFIDILLIADQFCMVKCSMDEFIVFHIIP